MNIGIALRWEHRGLNSLLQLGAIIDLIPPTFQIRLILEILHAGFRGDGMTFMFLLNYVSQGLKPTIILVALRHD